MRCRFIKLLLSISLCTISTVAFSASYIDISFDETIKQSDYIVLGTVVQGSTYNAISADLTSPRLQLSDIDLFSVVTFDNPILLESGQTVSLEEPFRLYIDGGEIPMPPAFKKNYPEAMVFGQGNSAIPTKAFSKGSRLIVFVNENRQSEVPIVGRFGVLVVNSDGTIYSNGKLVVGISNGQLVLSTNNKLKAVPARAEGPEPPIRINVVTNPTSLELHEIVNYIQQNIDSSRDVAQIVKNAIMPENASKYFIEGAMR